MWPPDVRLAVTLIQVPPSLRKATDRLVATWEGDGRVGRVWQGDASVWTGADEDRWIGWLHVAGNQLALIENGDAVRLLGFFQQVGRHHDGDPKLTLQQSKVLPQVAPRARVQARARLVQ